MNLRHWVLLLVWAGLLLCILMLMSRWQLIDYDPDGLLLDNKHRIALTQQLTRLHDSGGATAIHITDNECFCNLISRSHRQEVTQILEDAGYINRSVSLADFAELKQFITAVPSIILFDDDNDLAFIGPYSTGLRCSAGKGLVESWLTSSVNIKDQGPSVVSAAKGCYCSV